MHGSIAPTRVLISLEFDSHLSGVNQDKISTKKFKTAHNGFPPFSIGEGREGSLFFPLSFFRLSLLIRPISHTADQASVLGSSVRRIAHKRIVCLLSCLKRGQFWQTRGVNAFNAFLDHCASLNARLENWVWKDNRTGRFFRRCPFLGPPHPHLTFTRPQRADAVHHSKRHEKGKRSLLREGCRTGKSLTANGRLSGKTDKMTQFLRSGRSDELTFPTRRDYLS